VILCVGLTPAQQQIMVFDHFRLGEVNRASQVAWCTSGKVVNLAVAVRLLGEECLMLSTVGGQAAAQIDREMEELGIGRRWVHTQSATRVCTTILDRGACSITELVENGRPLLPGELEEFAAVYAEEAARADVAAFSGSLPAGTPAAYYRRLVEKTRCPAVFDFRGEGLLGCLDLKPYVVKPNREELGQTMGRPIRDDDQLLAAMRELNRRGAQWVVITQGAGPVWVTSLSRAWRLYPPPAGEVVNPIGCGDALTAGIACATRRGADIVEAVQLGMAAAAANLQHLLPGRFDSAGIEERARGVRVEELYG
jgi:1-phosphofructokinase family hexose kinase